MQHHISSVQKINDMALSKVKVPKCFAQTKTLCIGGSKGGVRDARPPLGVQILSISCSFRENLACSRPPWRVHAPPSGKSWIRHCCVQYIVFKEETGQMICNTDHRLMRGRDQSLPSTTKVQLILQQPRWVQKQVKSENRHRSSCWVDLGTWFYLCMLLCMFLFNWFIS